MYRKMMVFALAGILLLLLGAIVFAQTENVRPVTEDGYWSRVVNPEAFFGTETYLWTRSDDDNCSPPKRSVLLKWDLHDITNDKIVGDVKIVLHHIIYVDGHTDGDTVFGFFEAPDNWSESDTSLPFSPPDPTTTPALASMTLPTTLQAGDDLTFTVSGSSDPLVQYVQQQIQGDKVVSLWAQYVSGCGNGGSGMSRLHWDSREAGTTTMSLWTPNAVTLTEMSSQRQEVNWTLLAGVILLISAMVVGISYSARRLNL
jgi:hypothetical protein